MHLIRGNNSLPNPENKNQDVEFELKKKQIDAHLKNEMEKIRVKHEFDEKSLLQKLKIEAKEKSKGGEINKNEILDQLGKIN